METRRAIPKFSSAKAGVVPTFIFIGKVESGTAWMVSRFLGKVCPLETFLHNSGN